MSVFSPTVQRRRRAHRAKLAEMRAIPSSGGWIMKRDGRLVPAANLLEWASYMEKARHLRGVARDFVEDVLVSTVFLGLDHSHGFGPPLLYETMTFGADDETGGPWRYPTRAEALAGHAQVVAQVEAALALTGVDPGTVAS